MFNGLNLSVYLSEAERQLPLIEAILPKGSFVFTSFHIAEEVDASYRSRATEICRRLKADGYRLMADVSRKTLALFEMDSIEQFARELDIDLLRIDYGYSDDELAALAEQQSIVINCSTVSRETAVRLGQARNQVYGLHNFYPRPETGLDCKLFERLNARMREAGIEPMAFVAGDDIRRGPLFEGLPTLEHHRSTKPYLAYLELVLRYGINGVFVGDGIVSKQQFALIEQYCNTGIVQLPTRLSGDYSHLYNQRFTVRVDSPAWAARVEQSREYATKIPNLHIEPQGNTLRTLGGITIDNCNYGRYQGEVQLVRSELSADPRVNVIGEVEPAYRELLSLIENGMDFSFVPQID